MKHPFTPIREVIVYCPAHTAGLEASAYRQVLEGLKDTYGKAQP